MANLTLEKFECDGETGSVGIRWERWKRSLNIYLEAAKIDTAAQKRASLLHFGGPELQEIFFNIPGTEDGASNEGDVFTSAIAILDAYFAPKQSKRFERHIFRQIKQEEDEKFEKYLVRLRQQASKCQFTDVEDHLIDQITEKCYSEDLRKKILRSGDKITLNDIVSEANALEAIHRQLEGFDRKGHNHTTQAVNAMGTKKTENETQKKKECFRCGSWSHLAYDDRCPAKGKKCLQCGKIGHFKAHCKTNPLKRKFEEKTKQDKSRQDAKKFKRSDKEVRNIEEYEGKHSGDDTVDYVFNIDDDAVVACKVGGAEVNMLIDSGCKHNLITDKT
ncbi:uncharacterized protein LOC119692645 [Plutella xylostella]|uniref:uncharacterized protein LOC119692645 n=1 Tax=Plutella xylostella TaxID=51655 RepID=UPI0020328028|nr:uncharacterized protein LOC119692645 [Plutella xylostella]